MSNEPIRIPTGSNMRLFDDVPPEDEADGAELETSIPSENAPPKIRSRSTSRSKVTRGFGSDGDVNANVNADADTNDNDGDNPEDLEADEGELDEEIDGEVDADEEQQDVPTSNESKNKGKMSSADMKLPSIARKGSSSGDLIGKPPLNPVSRGSSGKSSNRSTRPNSALSPRNHGSVHGDDVKETKETKETKNTKETKETKDSKGTKETSANETRTRRSISKSKSVKKDLKPAKPKASDESDMDTSNTQSESKPKQFVSQESFSYMPGNFNPATNGFPQARKPRGNHLFTDDDVDFNFVGDFSKLLSMMRYLVNTVNQQAETIKQLEQTVETHQTQLEGFGATGSIGPQLAVELSRMVQMPDGRSLIEAVASTEQDVVRSLSYMHEQSGKIENIEKTLLLKSDRDTTVNVLLFDSLAKEFKETKDTVSQLSNEMIQVRIMASAPQATDEVCRQKVDDLQYIVQKMDESLVLKLDKREYTYFLEGMMKKQREVEAGIPEGSRTEQNDGQSGNLVATGVSKMLNTSEPPFTSAIKNLSDVFLKTYWSGPGSVACALTDPAVLSRIGKSSDRYQSSSDGVILSKEIEKLNFLVNLKPYKHDVEEMIGQQCISKSQLEVRLSAFFKQLKKVFQTDLNAFFQKVMQDPKSNASDKRPSSGMDYSQSDYSIGTTTTGLSGMFGSKNFKTIDEVPGETVRGHGETSRIYGPSPRVGSADSRSTHISTTASAVPGIPGVGLRNQGRISELRSSNVAGYNSGQQRQQPSGQYTKADTTPTGGTSGNEAPLSSTRNVSAKGSGPRSQQSAVTAEIDLTSEMTNAPTTTIPSPLVRGASFRAQLPNQGNGSADGGGTTTS